MSITLNASPGCYAIKPLMTRFSPIAVQKTVNLPYIINTKSITYRPLKYTERDREKKREGENEFFTSRQ